VPQNGKKRLKNLLWLFWTISLKRMNLIIWLGAYVKA
jgi:hypothetical protein